MFIAPSRHILRWLLAVTAAVAAVALAARAWIGPYQFGMSVHSPMNAESIFGAALLLLVLTAEQASPHAPAKAATRSRYAVALGILLVATVAAFAPDLNVGLVADDYSHLYSASRANLTTVAHWFTVPASDNLFFRPVTMASYWIDSQWAGFSAFRWHAAELGLHLVNVLLVFLLTRKLALTLSPALFAALLFAIHGSRPEAVTWVAARFDLLATGFVLLSLLLFLSYRQRPRPGMLTLLLSATLFGLLSKESAFVLPALMAAIAWFYRDRSRAVIRAISAVALLSAVTFIYRWIVVGGIGGYVDPQGRTTISTFNVALAVKALLLRLGAVLLVPINWTDPLGSALCLTLPLALGTVLLLVIRARRDRLVLFALAFTLIAALPVYHLLLIGPDLEKSRVIYLGSAGFAILIAGLARNVSPLIALAAAVGLLVFNATALQHNLATWDRVARIHLAACDYLGVESHGGDILVIGAPNTWDGVYMLKTGLPECIAIRHGGDPRRVRLAPERLGSFRQDGQPLYVWDDKTARMARWD